MKQLTELINEKLRISKGPVVPDLIALIESKDKNDFIVRLQQLLEYVKNDNELPIAEMIDWHSGLKKLARKYQRSYDTFLWILNDFMCYGTWDDMYSVHWSRLKRGVRNYINGGDGFKDFAANDNEISENGGVYIITENKELLKQLDYLKQKSEPL
jgi:hypothetical protein